MQGCTAHSQLPLALDEFFFQGRDPKRQLVTCCNVAGFKRLLFLRWHAANLPLDAFKGPRGLGANRAHWILTHTVADASHRFVSRF